MAVIPRFRMVAGPNGSGKTTLWHWLECGYSVNFYTTINADAMFSEARSQGSLRAPLPVSAASLARYLSMSGYPGEVTEPFRDGRIVLSGDCFRFKDAASVTTYTVSLLANFLQAQMIDAGMSFSQETVFSHPGKVEALRRAKSRGFRTYLYYVATETPAINIRRVWQRVSAGGHDVPVSKIVERHARSLAQVPSALEWVSRAYFFDNSGETMQFLAEFDDTTGWRVTVPERKRQGWFRRIFESGNMGR